MTSVEISNLNYKKNLSTFSPGTTNVTQFVYLDRKLFALNADHEVNQLNNSWGEISDKEDFEIKHLLPVGDLLYAGTNKGLYLWQGNSNWVFVSGSAFTGGENNTVRSLLKLISFSGFIHAIVDDSEKVIRWNGSSWAQVGAIPTTGVKDLAVFNDQLYSGGINGVRRWTGTNWAPLGSLEVTVNVLHIFNGQLHAGVSGGVRRWSGSSWVSLTGLVENITSMVTLKDALYAATASGSETPLKAGVYKRIGSSWAHVAVITNVNTIYPLGSELLIGVVGDIQQLTSATFVNNTISLNAHGFLDENEVFVKCISGGFVSRVFEISNDNNLTNQFNITPSPNFIVRENINFERSGATLTMTYPGHGLVNNNQINLITPSALGLIYTNPLPVSVVDESVFTVQVVDQGEETGKLSIEKISGEVLVAKMEYSPATISRNESSGVVTVTRSNHGFLKGDYIHIKVGEGNANFDSAPAIVETVLSPNEFRIVKKTDPGSFYNNFGVREYHNNKIYGRGVSIYIIDEGFNDTDPNIPGIQPISDLADFEVIDFGDNGAGTSVSHGGLVGALLGASRKNGAGIIGVSPDAKLYLADVDDTQGSIFISKVVQAIDDAVSRGVDIINMSLGTSFSSSSLSQAVQRAVAANILVFASAGNSGSPIYEFPAAFDGVISVASVTYNKQKSSFNTRNEKVALFAPGEGYPLPSPISEQNILRVDGTSFSCPFAAGIAALYIQDERLKRGDPSWRPTREEAIEKISEVLGTQGMSYPAPGFSPVALFSGGTTMMLVYVAIAFVGIIILSMVLSKFLK